MTRLHFVCLLPHSFISCVNMTIILALSLTHWYNLFLNVIYLAMIQYSHQLFLLHTLKGNFIFHLKVCLQVLGSTTARAKKVVLSL